MRSKPVQKREAMLEAFIAGWQAALAVNITNPRVLAVVESCFELWLQDACEETDVLGLRFRGRQDLPKPAWRHVPAWMTSDRQPDVRRRAVRHAEQVHARLLDRHVDELRDRDRLLRELDAKLEDLRALGVGGRVDRPKPEQPRSDVQRPAVPRQGGAPPQEGAARDDRTPV